MLYTVIVLTGSLIGAQLAPECQTVPAAATPVDTVVIRRVDVDADGELDELRFHLRAPRFDQPFLTEIEIRSKGQALLRRADSDSALDKWFADSSFMGGCVGYAKCKCLWYFVDLPTWTILKLPESLGDGVYDRTRSNSIYSVAKRHLIRECGASSAAADIAIAKAVARMRAGKTVAIAPSVTPVVAGGNPLVWFPEFRCFAPVYQE